jgi:hypothetical protein
MVQKGKNATKQCLFEDSETSGEDDEQQEGGHLRVNAAYAERFEVWNSLLSLRAWSFCA